MHSIEDADPQGHEGFGEVDDLFPLSCDGECGHSQVCLLLEGKQGRGRGVARETDGQLGRNTVREQLGKLGGRKERRTGGVRSQDWLQGCPNSDPSHLPSAVSPTRLPRPPHPILPNPMKFIIKVLLYKTYH